MKKLKPLLILSLLLFTTILIHDSLVRHTAAASSRQAAAAAQEALAQLGSTVNAVIDDSNSTDVSVALINIDTGTAHDYGVRGPMIGASTTKVLTAVTYMDQVEHGKASLYQKINGIKASSLLYGMLNQSNDDDWVDLNYYLTYPVITAYANAHGWTAYKWASNSMSTANEAALLTQLYTHKLLNTANTNFILNALQNTNNEDLIPPALPASATVYHKYGEYATSLHDAAIITNEGKSYALVIYTAGKDRLDYRAQQAIIQQITKAVVSYEEKA